MKTSTGCIVAGLVLAAIGASAEPADSVGPAVLLGGGGLAGRELPHDDMPPLLRADIERRLQESAQALVAAGAMPQADPAQRVEGLIWPLRARPGHGDPDYHGISNFVDLNPAFPNQLLDYTCAARTYDQAGGYNHAGIDYFLWPFSWRMMDAALIEIVAAAPGTIVLKQDGFGDRSCPGHYSADWNAVYVQHADGSVAWYGHMKQGSLTAKPVGAAVQAGEFLGLVGSSGFSSGPHLHFELRSSSLPGSLILEPHSGACRAGPSLWAVQRPYWDSAVNKLATHSAAPSFAVSCPNPGQETPNFKDRFIPGVDALIVAAYYRDQQQGSSTAYRLYRAGQTLNSWNHASDGTYAASYWYWQLALPAQAPPGAWVFEAQYNGRTYRHEFIVGDDVIFASSIGG